MRKNAKERIEVEQGGKGEGGVEEVWGRTYREEVWGRSGRKEEKGKQTNDIRIA